MAMPMLSAVTSVLQLSVITNVSCPVPVSPLLFFFLVFCFSLLFDSNCSFETDISLAYPLLSPAKPKHFSAPGSAFIFRFGSSRSGQS